MPQAFAYARRLVDDVISSPINICLVALICYFSYKLIKKDNTLAGSDEAAASGNSSGGAGSGRSRQDRGSKSKRVFEKMPKQDFTLEQLKQYDGIKSDGRLLVGILGKVFDVSMAADFYGPGGPYSVFAGHDASRALATFSVDAAQFKDEYDDLSDLKPSQLESVKEWEMQFLGNLLLYSRHGVFYIPMTNN
jgi:predicted heme/steroid binding protein